jgi:hypothetical protein
VRGCGFVCVGVGDKGREALGVDGLGRSPRDRAGATCHMPLSFKFNLIFSIFLFFFFHHSRPTNTVFRRHYASVGQLGPVPAAPRRITENRRPPRRCDHRQRRRSVGTGSLVRWRCPRRCVLLSSKRALPLFFVLRIPPPLFRSRS